MGILDLISGKKDPEILEAEQKAFLDETAKVNKERQERAIKDAEDRGRAKAHGSGTPLNLGGIGKALEKVGKSAMDIGEGYAEKHTGDNMFDMTAPWETPRKKKKCKGTSNKKKSKKGISSTKPHKNGNSGKHIHIHVE